MNASFFLYGAVIIGFMLWGDVVEQKLLQAEFYHYGLRKRVKATPMIVLRYMIGKEFYLVGVFILALVMAAAVGGFLFYHLWLVYKNMTTNESSKWGSLRTFHSYMQESRSYFLAEKKKNPDFVAPLYVLPADFEGDDAQNQQAQEGQDPPKDDVAGQAAVSKQEPEPLHITAENATFPLMLSLRQLPQYLDFDPPAVPTNIYDQGIVNNFREVLLPRYDAVMQDLYASMSASGESNKQSANKQASGGKKKKAKTS